MVHRVAGLDPGLYFLLRAPSVLADFRSSMHREWLWQKKGPEHLPLYLLLPYDLRAIAKTICCHQDIAADSCFALGMLAHVELAHEEPWRYRHLFWECGILGHALYLEAEAAGVRSTGIGCYFDDEMHKLLGIDDDRWQSLYHFTVGGPVESWHRASERCRPTPFSPDPRFGFPPGTGDRLAANRAIAARTLDSPALCYRAMC